MLVVSGGVSFNDVSVIHQLSLIDVDAAGFGLLSQAVATKGRCTRAPGLRRRVLL